jgi:hypothetical protein
MMKCVSARVSGDFLRRVRWARCWAWGGARGTRPFPTVTGNCRSLYAVYKPFVPFSGSAAFCLFFVWCFSAQLRPTACVPGYVIVCCNVRNYKERHVCSTAHSLHLPPSVFYDPPPPRAWSLLTCSRLNFSLHSRLWTSISFNFCVLIYLHTNFHDVFPFRDHLDGYSLPPRPRDSARVARGARSSRLCWIAQERAGGPTTQHALYNTFRG